MCPPPNGNETKRRYMCAQATLTMNTSECSSQSPRFPQCEDSAKKTALCNTRLFSVAETAGKPRQNTSLCLSHGVGRRNNYPISQTNAHRRRTHNYTHSYMREALGTIADAILLFRSSSTAKHTQSRKRTRLSLVLSFLCHSSLCVQERHTHTRGRRKKQARPHMRAKHTRAKQNERESRLSSLTCGRAGCSPRTQSRKRTQTLCRVLFLSEFRLSVQQEPHAHTRVVTNRQQANAAHTRKKSENRCNHSHVSEQGIVLEHAGSHDL